MKERKKEKAKVKMKTRTLFREPRVEYVIAGHPLAYIMALINNIQIKK